jgi:hypothetical protein
MKAFSPLNINAYPIRAAFEIGTANAITLTVARVDVRASAVRDTLYHTQLPLAVRVQPRSGLLDEASAADVVSKLRTLEGAVGRMNVTEKAGIMTAPFDSVANAEALRRAWTKEFKVDLRLACELPGGGASDGADWGADGALGRMAFLSYAAAAQHMRPENLLVLVERGGAEGHRLELIGMSSDEEVSTLGVPAGSRLCARLPLTTPLVHRQLVTDVQRRAAGSYHAAASPNPVTRGEFVTLRRIVEAATAPALPAWVTRRREADASIVGTGANGGLLNIAARGAGKAAIPLEHLEVTAEFHLCGLTDVLLAENYPAPQLVVAQLALAAGTLRALRCKRATYVPDVALTHAVLVDGAFWAQGRRAALEAALEDEPLQRKQRVFNRPHQAGSRFSPTSVWLGDKQSQIRQPMR